MKILLPDFSGPENTFSTMPEYFMTSQDRSAPQKAGDSIVRASSS
jgi:hypothetical protein